MNHEVWQNAGLILQHSMRSFALIRVKLQLYSLPVFRFWEGKHAA